MAPPKRKNIYKPRPVGPPPQPMQRPIPRTGLFTFFGFLERVPQDNVLVRLLIPFSISNLVFQVNAEKTSTEETFEILIDGRSYYPSNSKRPGVEEGHNRIDVEVPIAAGSKVQLLLAGVKGEVWYSGFGKEI